MPDKQKNPKTSRKISILAFFITLFIMLGIVAIAMGPWWLESKKLDGIEIQMKAHPEQALAQLQTMSRHTSRSLRGKKVWLQVCAMKQCGMTFNSDSLFKEALEHSPAENTLPQLHTYMGDYYMQHRQYAEAQKHYAQAYVQRKAVQPADTLQRSTYDTMLRLKRLLSKHPDASEAQLRAELDAQLQETELQDVKRQSEEEEKAWTELLSVFLAMGLFCLLLGEWRHRRRFRRLRHLLFSQADHIQTTDSEASTARQQLEEHQSMLLQREQQLRSSLTELQQSQMQGEEQRQQIRLMKDRLEQMQEEVFSSNPVVCKIRHLSGLDERQRAKAHQEYALGKDERKSLYEAMDLHNADFVSQMQSAFPLLNADDLLICVLLRMDVPNADVAFLLSCSEEALKKRKFRIKKDKLLQPSDGKPLDEFLHHFGSQDASEKDKKGLLR